jgi:hypothetical protein
MNVDGSENKQNGQSISWDGNLAAIKNYNMELHS